MAQKFGHVRTRVHRGKLRWYLQFGRIGRIWSLRGEPFASAEEAESILRAIRGDVARGVSREDAVGKWLPTHSAANRVDRWLERWLDDLRGQVEAGQRSPSYLRELERWCRPGRGGYLALLGKRSIHSIDYVTIRAWQDEVGSHVGGKTLWNVTAGLSAFLGWLRRIDKLERVPTIPWPRYDDHAPEIVLPAVQEAVLDQLQDAERGAFLAMALLGLRHSEAWVVDGRDYRDGRLWVRRARKGARLSDPVRGTKGRAPRILPVPGELAAWIDAHVEKRVLLSGGLLFPNPRTGRAWAPTSFRRAWAKACTAAGLPVLKPYETLRHSTATEWLRRGASEREVQALLGHRSGHMTPRYARLADERLAIIVSRKVDDGD